MNEPPSRRRATLTPLSLLLVLLVFYLIVEVRVILFLFVFAILFATIIEGPVIRLEGRGIPRPIGILIIYITLIAGLVGIGLVLVPPIADEALTFWDEAPELIDEIAEEWRTSDDEFLSTTGYRLLTQLKFRIENPPPPTGDTAVGVVSSVAGIGFGIVATFVIGFYYLMEKRLFRNFVITLIWPHSRRRMNAIWRDVELKVGDWLRGQLLLMIVIGVSAGVGYAIIGVRFWPLLAILAGLTEIIPILGPWIGGIPAVLIAATDSWQKAVITAIFIGVLQLAENTILVPRIMKGAIGLSPLAVFVAVLAGGQFYGPLGALLAIPVAAAIQVILNDVLRTRREDWSLETVDGDAQTTTPAWHWVKQHFLDDHQRQRKVVPVDPSERTNPDNPDSDDNSFEDPTADQPDAVSTDPSQ